MKVTISKFLLGLETVGVTLFILGLISDVSAVKLNLIEDIYFRILFSPELSVAFFFGLLFFAIMGALSAFPHSRLLLYSHICIFTFTLLGWFLLGMMAGGLGRF